MSPTAQMSSSAITAAALRDELLINGLATTWRPVCALDVAVAVLALVADAASGGLVVFPVLGADAASCRMSGVKTNDEFSWEPTAATVPSLRAVTPARAFPRLPGFGLLTTLQLIPSQCSVRVECSLVPTAQMSLAEMAAIPFNLLPLS